MNPRCVRTWLRRLGVALGVVVLLLVPVPYYITKPGLAEPIHAMVRVEGGSATGEGAFLLTTVSMMPGNVALYAIAALHPFYDALPKQQILAPHESPEEYTQRQLQVMRQSQENAEIVAFRKAGLPVDVRAVGVRVLEVRRDGAAAGVLEPGDVLVRVDDRPVRTREELLRALQGRRAGETVRVAFLREGKRREAAIRLKPLPLEPGEPHRAGLGIVPATERSVTLPRRVTVNAGSIGGPSAGLMFTLEILNQLDGRDWTKGYRIAGTGTIDEEGRVGPVGGVHQKVWAAVRAGADIFFVPAAAAPGEPSNAEVAKRAAKRLGSTLRVVPVRTVDDALRFLAELPPKAEAGPDAGV